MIYYGDFSEGDPVWVVDQYSDKREPDGVVRQITGSGQIVLQDGRRFTPRAEGYGQDWRGLLVIPVGRHKATIGKIQERLTAIGGLEALPVWKLERIADVLGK